jgi:hypothetical protein
MRRRLDQSRRKPHEFFLRYPDIAQWFPQIVDCWLNASDTIGHALVLLFSAIREPAAFLETRFLPIVQAAEVYARAETPGTLAHANELRLKQKMHALLDTLEPNTLTLFCKQRDEFVRGIVDTRNYYTHYSDRYDRVLQSMELHWATVKLQLMLKILLLKRLGVPESVLQAIIRKDHRLAAQRKEWSAITERGSPVRPSCSDPESAG